MKTYFTASLLYRKERINFYKAIVDTLTTLGHTVTGFDVLTGPVEDVMQLSDTAVVQSYKKFLKWIAACDQVVVEASFPSTINIGHEISIALEKGKPVIALYQKGQKPFFLVGMESEKLMLIEYTNEKDLATHLNEALQGAKELVDTRFNFYISPEINYYLDWINQNKKLPRAVFLRSLLEKAMKADKDFNK